MNKNAEYFAKTDSGKGDHPYNLPEIPGRRGFAVLIMDERGHTATHLEEASYSSGFAYTDRLFEAMGDDTQGACCQGV
jgi:hypothetical protein